MPVSLCCDFGNAKSATEGKTSRPPRQEEQADQAGRCHPLPRAGRWPHRGYAGHLERSCAVSSYQGWPLKLKRGRDAAVQEAREEVGVLGTPSKKPFGAYSYWKRLSDGFVNVNVKVYLLAVDEAMSDLQVLGKRERAWLSPVDASALIDERNRCSSVLKLSNRSGQTELEAAMGR